MVPAPAKPATPAPKVPTQAARAQQAEAKITPAVAKTMVKAAETVKQVNALRATQEDTKQLAKDLIDIKRGKYAPPVYIPGGDGDKKKKEKKEVIETVDTGTAPPPAAPVIPPVAKGGIVKSRNIRESYLKVISQLTSNLLKNADNLLFAYNFQTIERIYTSAIDQDDLAQRSSQIVSNIKRSFSTVPLTELQIRERLNAVINQISQEIGDLTPASSKLNKFGTKKDNLPFQGGVPRVENSRTLYDLELKLPTLEGFNYSVTYRIKCFDID